MMEAEAAQLARALRTWFRSAEGEMAMTNKAEDYGKHEHDCAGDVRGTMCVSCSMSDQRNHKGKRGSGERHAAGIDAQAAEPFLEIVALSPENKPLISEKSKRNGEQIREQTGKNISVRDERSQQHREQRKTAIAEDCVARTDGQVANQRCWGRPGLGRRRHVSGRAGPVARTHQGRSEMLRSTFAIIL
jgi:hypothetical protein